MGRIADLNARSRRRGLFALLFVGFAGCGAGDTSYLDFDPASVPAQPTWANDVLPRLDYYCGACHSPDAQVGLQEGLDLTNYEVAKFALLDIERTAMIERSMPPGTAQKMSAYDFAVIKRWDKNGHPK
ncbi:MAG: hypothetical protein H6707_15265 [Deltaproteobacteria bacterium]|nr:hypothetical protein [Deltaproteobacteria bacterium]